MKQAQEEEVIQALAQQFEENMRIDSGDEIVNAPAASTMAPPEEVKKPTFVKKRDRVTL